MHLFQLLQQDPVSTWMSLDKWVLIMKQAAEKTKDQNGFACAKLVVFCNPVEDNSFMAGAFHGLERVKLY